MTRWLPYPRLSLLLFGLWLILNQTWEPAHLLLAAVVAVAAPLLTRSFLPIRRGAHRLATILHLAGIVFVDIVRSNIAVAFIILGGRRKQTSSGFVRIPLALRNPSGLAALACIITSTPGTLWVNYDPERSELLLHVLDLIDEQAWHDIVKHRYESLLLEIFE